MPPFSEQPEDPREQAEDAVVKGRADVPDNSQGIRKAGPRPHLLNDELDDPDDRRAVESVEQVISQMRRGRPKKQKPQRASAPEASLDGIVGEPNAAPAQPEQVEPARMQQEKAQQAEQERLAAEQAEQERLAAERAEQERLAAERAEAESLAAERAEQERLAAERAEAERLAAERAEQERLAAERAEQERLAAERLAAEQLAAAQVEAERQAERERVVAEQLAAEQAARAQKLAQEAQRLQEEARVAAEAAAEQVRIAREREEQARMAAERAMQAVQQEPSQDPKPRQESPALSTPQQQSSPDEISPDDEAQLPEDEPVVGAVVPEDQWPEFDAVAVPNNLPAAVEDSPMDNRPVLIDEPDSVLAPMEPEFEAPGQPVAFEEIIEPESVGEAPKLPPIPEDDAPSREPESLEELWGGAQIVEGGSPLADPTERPSYAAPPKSEQKDEPVSIPWSSLDERLQQMEQSAGEEDESWASWEAAMATPLAVVEPLNEAAQDENEEDETWQDEHALALAEMQQEEEEDQTQEPDLEESTARMALSASRGVFRDPSEISLISSRLKPSADELNNAFAAFSSLTPGQEAFISITARTYPDFNKRAESFLREFQYGVEIKRSNDSIWNKINDVLTYGFRKLWHEMAKDGGVWETPAPKAPWAKEKGDRKPKSKIEMGDSGKQTIDYATDKARSVAHYETKLNIGVWGLEEDKKHLEAIRKQIEAGFEDYTTNYQRIIWEPDSPFDAAKGLMDFEQTDRLVLSAEEIGELARIPDDLSNAPGVKIIRAPYRQLHLGNPIKCPDPFEPPTGVIPLGLINKGTEDETGIGMRVADLDKHMFLVGRTGTGKSVLMEWLIHGCVKAGYPIVLVDPHGTLVENVMNNCIIHCPERLDDIVVVDFSEEDWPIALNPLDISSKRQIEPTIGAVMEMLSQQLRLGGDSAPRATNFTTQAVTALAEANIYLQDADTKCTLLQVETFFTDPVFRSMVVQLCSNPAIKSMYDPETGPFELLGEKQRNDFIQPILRAFGRLSNSAAFANSFASGENRLDFTNLILNNKIILLKLSRFSHQKALASFVGSLIIPYLLQSMDDWGRKRDPKTLQWVGRGCRLFVDEAPTMLGPESRAMEVLAEARKWDLGMIVAAQFPTQFDKAVESALYGNTASKVTLALDPGNVGGIARSIDAGTKRLDAGDITGLPKYVAYGNVLLSEEDGSGGNSGPFTMATLAPHDMLFGREKPGQRISDEHEQLVARVNRTSRGLVCNPRREVEALRMNQVERLKAALAQIIGDQARESGIDSGSSLDDLLTDFDDLNMDSGSGAELDIENLIWDG